MSPFSSTLVFAFVGIGAIVFVVQSHAMMMSPSDKFADCCREIKPPLREDSIRDCCKFVPENPTTVEAKDLGMEGHYNPYVQCYTNKKDNRECCRKNGVVGEFEICQQLCDGTHHHPAPPPSPLYICETSYVKANISMCNEAAYGPGM